jgi:hypothetical protein
MCSVHEDLVSTSPSLCIDGKQIIASGTYVLSPEDWYESPKQHIHLKNTDLTEKSQVRRTFVDAERTSGNQLRVCRSVEKIRVCSYRIGDASTNQDLWAVYALVPMFPATVAVSKIRSKIGIGSQDYLLNCIRLLIRHRLLEVA